MSYRSYYDPHYKPDRSPSKYRADKRRDELAAADATAFVAKFLATYQPKKPGSSDPAAVLKALRTEARRQGKTRKRGHSSAKGTLHSKPNKKNPRRQNKKNTRDKARDLRHLPRNPESKEKPPAHPWLKRKSSLKFLKVSDEELLTEYFSICDKIECWRAERSKTTDQRRRSVLAEQVQVQFEKRHDLLAIICDRTIDDSLDTTKFGEALKSKP